MIAPGSASKEFKQQIANLGLPEIRFHDLKHLHLAMLVAAGTDIKTVSSRAGHHSVAFTLYVYVDSVEENERAAVYALSEQIFGS